MSANPQRRPDEILAEIGRTRREMDGTLHAIEERLTPGQLVDQGLEYLRSSGAKEFASNLGGSVKSNPLPVALVGIGIAWLMAAGKNGRSSQDAFATDSSTSSFTDAGSAKLDRAKAQMGSAKEQLSQGMRSARDGVDRAKGSVQSMLDEQPLALGAIGVAIGAVMAAAAPRTAQEDRILGPASDRLKEQAREAVSEKAQAVSEKAQAIEQNAKEASPPAEAPRPVDETPRAADSLGKPKPHITVPAAAMTAPRVTTPR